MIIRQAKISEAGQILSCLSSLSPTENADVNEAKNIICTTKDYIVVAVEGEEVVGTGRLNMHQKLIRDFGWVGQIEEIAVKDGWQGKGVGRLIVEHLVEKAQVRGAYKVVLNCNEVNVDFYKKCGFRPSLFQMRVSL